MLLIFKDSKEKQEKWLIRLRALDRQAQGPKFKAQEPMLKAGYVTHDSIAPVLERDRGRRIAGVFWLSAQLQVQ